jgi:hypothetical protein
MDAPDRQLDALCVERLLPGKDVLIDAVNERAVEINRKAGSIRMLSFPFWTFLAAHADGQPSLAHSTSLRRKRHATLALPRLTV